MKKQTVRVQMPAGEFKLDQNAQGILSWTSPYGSPLPPPETGTIRLWDGCMDAAGEFHLFVHTASRHLIHCRTSDGQHWQRHTLSRLDREDVELTDLACSALPSLTLVYLISGAGRSPSAVCYSQNTPGSWQGRRIELPWPSSEVSIIRLLSAAAGLELYTLHGQNSIFRIPLSNLPARQICSYPSPIQHPQILRTDDDRLHMAFISGQQAYADGYPLPCRGYDICLYIHENRLFCACRTEHHWQSYVFTDQSWQSASTLPPEEPQLILSPKLCCLQPPTAPPSVSAHTPPAEPASGLSTILRNQAILLSALQESFRELQQQHFALHAQVQALENQQKNVSSLKEKYARLEAVLDSSSNN